MRCAVTMCQNLRFEEGIHVELARFGVDRFLSAVVAAKVSTSLSKMRLVCVDEGIEHLDTKQGRRSAVTLVEHGQKAGQLGPAAQVAQLAGRAADRTC
jgi:hypothetical protein